MTATGPSWRRSIGAPRSHVVSHISAKPAASTAIASAASRDAGSSPSPAIAASAINVAPSLAQYELSGTNG